MANVPFLTPTPYTLPQATPAPTPSPSLNDVEDLINYLDNNVREIPKSVSPRVKKLQEDIKSIYNRMKLFEVRGSNSALRNFARVYTIDGIEEDDALSFLQNARKNVTSVLRINRKTKVKLILRCNMHLPRTDEINPYAFHSDIEINLHGTDENELYDTRVERILEEIAKCMSKDSDVRFHSVIKLELHTAEYVPLRGDTWISLPKELANKKAIINMKNEDNRCFLWCVLRALNPKEHNPERVDKPKENTLNMEGIEYPVSLKDLNKFEKQNPNIVITVLGYNRKSVYPLRNSINAYKRKHNIILMLIKEERIHHYCLVKKVVYCRHKCQKLKEKNIFVRDVLTLLDLKKSYLSIWNIVRNIMKLK